jgi:hypothetical protein
MTRDYLIHALESRYIPEPNSGCWLWTGVITDTGYGDIRFSRTKRERAHRLSYRLFKGEIPEGMTLDHMCGVRCCVNPDHLVPATLRDNVLRTHKDAHKTHCLRGHEFTVENTLIVRRGASRIRQCRTCNRERKFARYHGQERS